MGLRAVERDTIPKIAREQGPSKTAMLIEEFVSSGVDAAMVEDGEYGKGFASGLNKRAKEGNLPVKALRRGDQMYLVRFDWTAEDSE